MKFFLGSSRNGYDFFPGGFRHDFLPGLHGSLFHRGAEVPESVIHGLSDFDLFVVVFRLSPVRGMHHLAALGADKFIHWFIQFSDDTASVTFHQIRHESLLHCYIELFF